MAIWRRLCKALFNLYLWFTGKKMSIEQCYSELLILRNQVFESLETHLKIEQEKGYVSFVKRDDEQGIFLFNVGEQPFMLKSNISPHRRDVLFKTFHRPLDLDVYPEIARYKQTLVGELDIVYTFSTVLKFVTPKETYGDFPGLRKKVTIDRITKVADFGKLYIEQVNEFLNKNGL